MPTRKNALAIAVITRTARARSTMSAANQAKNAGGPPSPSGRSIPDDLAPRVTSGIVAGYRTTRRTGDPSERGVAALRRVRPTAPSAIPGGKLDVEEGPFAGLGLHPD